MKNFIRFFLLAFFITIGSTASSQSLKVMTYNIRLNIASGKLFWVFNTRLDHIGEIARTKSIKLILSKTEALNRPGYPVIFMGDFNSGPETERIISLKKEMIDSRSASENEPFGPSGTFNGFKHNEPVTHLIDYIFISKNEKLKVLKYVILSDSKDMKYPSDHLPAYVELEYQ